MLLFCWPCNRLHRYPPGEVERIVYTLAGIANTAEQDAWHGNRPMEDPGDELWCLDAVRDLSYSQEGYAEHVEQGVGIRRDRQRDHRP
jgi:hypothetical protein